MLDDAREHLVEHSQNLAYLVLGVIIFSSVESRFVVLRVYLRTRGQYTCTYPLYIRVCNIE
jgi:hypothetical protein